MRHSSTQPPFRYVVWNYQYDLAYVTFANICSTMTRVAATIEFTILVLSLVGIRRASQHRESRLASFLKAQGIVYFVMVFLIHLFVVASGPGSPVTDIR